MTRLTHERARSCQQGSAPRHLHRIITLAAAAAVAAALTVGCSGNPITGPEPVPNGGGVIPQPQPQPQPTPQSAQPPDLVVSTINFSPGSPTTTDEITFWVFVKNEGSGVAPASTLHFRVGGETYPAAAAVPALASGQEYRYERRVTLGVAQGYQVTATADALDQVEEANESNNVRIRTFHVAPAAAPDLVVSLINFSPGAPRVGDQVTFWVFVKNEGTGHAPASSLQFRVGGESHPPVVGVPALAPGQQYRYTRQVTLHFAQWYQATGTADFHGSVNESDEGNNVTSRSFEVAP